MGEIMRRSILNSSAQVRPGLMMLMVMLTLALVACESDGNLRVMVPKYTLSEIDQAERSRLISEVTALREDVDRDLEKIHDRFELIDPKLRDEWNYADRKLKSNRAKIEKTLQDLYESRTENWQRVKTSTVMMMEDIRSSSDKLSYQFQDLFEEELSLSK